MEISQIAVKYMRNTITANPVNVTQVVDMATDSVIRQIPPDDVLVRRSKVDLYV